MLYPEIPYRNYNPTLEQLVTSGFQPFDDTWSTYLPEHKTILCGKIMRAYWFYQIGQETPDRFKHYLNQTLERVMPYYNQMYKSELMEINPLINHYLSTDGHTVQDLMKEVSKADSAVGQALRDFANSAKDTTDFAGNLAGAYQTTSSRDITEDYTKEGTDDKTTDRTETINRTEEETTNVTDKKTTDKETTETTNATTTTTEDNTVTLDRTENETTKTTSNETMEETKEETIHTEGSGNSTTNETMTQTVNSQKDYADTPQKNLANNTIRSDYLTNVTWNDEDTDRTTNTTVNNSYQEDKTDNTTTNRTTDETEDVARELTQKDSTVEKKSKEEELTKTVNGTLNETVDTTTDTTRNLTADQNEGENIKEDRDWTENGTTKTDDDFNEQRGTNEDTKSNTVGEHFDNGSSNETTSSASSSETKENEKRHTDDKQLAQGFLNVSQSSLLMAFRETFLNIDSLIIDEVRDCFMEVF